MSERSSGRDPDLVDGGDGAGAGDPQTASVLLVKDCDPWGTTANEDALGDLGVRYDRAESAALSGVDLSKYSTVVVPSTQSDEFYEALVSAPAGGGDCGTGSRTFEGRLEQGERATHEYAADAEDCRVELVLDGPRGADLDLYVTLDGREPTASDYDYRSRGLGAEESVAVPADHVESGTTLGILVRSYSGAGEYVLRVGTSVEGTGGLETFVAEGGTLVAHAVTTGGACSATRDHQFLPGGVRIGSATADSLSIADPSHPVVSQVDGDRLDADLSAGVGLSNLPSGATAFVESDGTPTAVEYPHGDGTVVATGLPVERAWGDASAGAAYLRNELSYATPKVSGSLTTLSLFPGDDETPPDGHRLNSALPDFGGMAVDGWFYGDMIERLDEDLHADVHYDKSLPTYPGEQFRRFRFKNTLQVSFSTEDDGSIDPESVVVRGNDDEPASYVSLVDRGPGRLTRYWVKRILFGLDVSKKRPASLREPHTASERVEIDGVEGVRAARIYGAFDPYVEDMLDTIVEEGVALFFDLLGMDPIERVLEFVSATPSIYTFAELTVLADGRKLARVWDASRFPRHAGYLDGTKHDATNFQKGRHWEENQFWNARFGEWVQEAESQFLSPYGSSALGYTSRFRLGYGDHPVMVFGQRANGTPIEESEVRELLPDEPLMPL